MRVCRLFALSVGSMGVSMVTCESAWANNPPMPQTGLSEIVLLPLVHLLFLISGAAAIQGSLSPNPDPWRKGKITLIVVMILFSFSHEAYAIPVSLFLGYLGIRKAIVMFSLSAHSKQWVMKARIVLCGILAIAVSIALAGTSFAMVGYWPGDTSVLDNLCCLHLAEKEYFKNLPEGEGKGYAYMHLLYAPEKEDDLADFPGKERMILAFRFLNSHLKRGEFGSTFDFKPEEAGYELRIWPRVFVAWPYRIVSPRRSYYTDETGVIRYKEVYSEETLAGPSSPVLDTSRYPLRWRHPELYEDETK